MTARELHRNQSQPHTGFPWCWIAAKGHFREIQLVQVGASAADADGPQLGLTAVQVSPDSLGAELRLGRRLAAKFGLRCRLPRRAARGTARLPGHKRRKQRRSECNESTARAKVTPPSRRPPLPVSAFHIIIRVSHALSRWRADNTDGRRHERR